MITSFARMQISYTGVLFFLVQDYFVFSKQERNHVLLQKRKVMPPTQEIYFPTQEIYFPTQEKLFLLHRRSYFSYTGDPFPSPAAARSSLFHCTGQVGTGFPHTNLRSVFLEMANGVLKPPRCLEVLAKEPPKSSSLYTQVKDGLTRSNSQSS